MKRTRHASPRHEPGRAGHIQNLVSGETPLHTQCISQKQMQAVVTRTLWMPLSAASLAISASLSAGIPASGPYWLIAGSAAAAATASSAAAGGAQCTMPAHHTRTEHDHR